MEIVPLAQVLKIWNLMVLSELAGFFIANRSLGSVLKKKSLAWQQGTSYESEKGAIMIKLSLVSSTHAKTSLYSQVHKVGFLASFTFWFKYLDSSRTLTLTFIHKTCVVAHKILVHAQHLLNQILPFTSSRMRLKTTLSS